MTLFNPFGPFSEWLVASWLGHLVIGFVVGSVIGLVRWRGHRKDIRGHPAGFMLRWGGVVIGLYLLSDFFDILFIIVFSWLILDYGAY